MLHEAVSLAVCVGLSAPTSHEGDWGLFKLLQVCVGEI